MMKEIDGIKDSLKYVQRNRMPRRSRDLQAYFLCHAVPRPDPESGSSAKAISQDLHALCLDVLVRLREPELLEYIMLQNEDDVSGYT